MARVYDVDLKYRALDEDGDMVVGKNAFLYRREALAQSIKTRLKLFANEWWEGDAGAIDMFGAVLGSPGTTRNRSEVDLLFVARIMDTIGVLDVTDVKSEILSGRRYCFSCRAITQYGDITIEEVF